MPQITRRRNVSPYANVDEGSSVIFRLRLPCLCLLSKNLASGSPQASLYLDICDVALYSLGHFQYEMASKSYENYSSRVSWLLCNTQSSIDHINVQSVSEPTFFKNCGFLRA